MRIRKQISLRQYWSGHSTELKVTDEEIYEIAYKSYRKDLRISKNRYQIVATYVDEVFCALAKYDKRFDFDPIPFEDNRCEIISSSEIKLVCELKNFPDNCYKIVGDIENGEAQIRMLENDNERSSETSWKDMCTNASRSEENYLNTRKLLDNFTTALGQAVRDVWNKHRSVGLVYRVSDNQARIYIDIPETGYFSVTLIPAFKINAYSTSRTGSTLDLISSLAGQDPHLQTLHAIAQPSVNFHDESWKFCYGTIEKTVMNAEQFTCGRVCLHALRHLLVSCKSPRLGLQSLTEWHLRTAVIQEFTKLPEAKDWTPTKFIKRLTGTLTSLKSCLREGIFVNHLSGANMLSNFDEKSLKVSMKDVEHAMHKFREKLKRWELS